MNTVLSHTIVVTGSKNAPASRAMQSASSASPHVRL
jgi:hypothetical protein